MLLIEQNTRGARLAHRGHVLEGGRIVLEGEARALAEDPKVQNAYLGGRAR